MACHAGRARNESVDVRCHSKAIARLYGKKACNQPPCPSSSAAMGPCCQRSPEAPLTSRQRMAGKFGGDEISAQMATCPAANSCQQEHGSGCPQCCGRKVCKHNSLATKALMVAAHWDYEENVGRPDSVVAQSSQPVALLCEVCGHRRSAPPHHRVRSSSGCAQCAKADA